MHVIDKHPTDADGHVVPAWHTSLKGQVKSACRVQKPCSTVKIGLSSAGNKEQMYIELVQGLGETIVGNWPGSALSYTAEKRLLPSLAETPEAPRSFPEGLISIKGFPSKSHALRQAEGGRDIIFRSDSNGEDLEGCVYVLIGCMQKPWRAFLKTMPSG